MQWYVLHQTVLIAVTRECFDFPIGSDDGTFTFFAIEFHAITQIVHVGGCGCLWQDAGHSEDCHDE